ncbi:hypothetical protein [Massiliimalia timonensis]|uniref:hypothetical protein n=1 Tax=Massiliimalia timonensis TaxID=1987501 RepID=UPI00189D3EF1|nr:hypothetical protein [Massiliimalia timonensis]
MLAVCNGNQGCGTKRYMTCDANRGNIPLTVNPLNASTLSSVAYKSNGTIFSHNTDINKDLNIILNLNCSRVGPIENRRKALQTMLNELRKKHPKGDINLTCIRLLEKYRSQTKKSPYLGILIWWLQEYMSKG